jgi:hypothetical protein
MKKSLIIIALCALQSACSTTELHPDSTGALLSFAELANEITVNHVESSEVTKASHTDNETSVSGPLGTP